MKPLLIPVLTVLSGALVLGACKKSDTAAVSGTYVSNNLVSVDPPRMYYAGGSSTDTALIGPYLRRTVTFGASYDQYIQLSGFATPMTNPITLTVNGTAATLQSGATTIGLDVLSEDATGLLLARRDSSLHYLQGNRCERLWRRLVLNRPDSVYIAIPGNGNFSSTAARYRTYYPLDIDGGRVYFPQLSVVLSATQGCMTASGAFAGRFDPQLPAQLLAGDTVVVQGRRLEMLRQ
ncbi:MAG: hypothetical protein EOO16_14420 [Chitinophagaceae bacterium]|nr:MAG: hypothetical protein EOO16_14420 [Chitinophagaceae bacterium]